MKNWILRLLIDFCCGKALKYDQRINMFNNLKGILYIYTVGSNVVQRDKWLKRINLLQQLIGKE